VLICYGLSLVVNYSILYINYEGLVNKAEALSYVDKLTGTLSRGAFFATLSKKLAEVRRGMGNICLALLDIDNFKQVNDTYGHLAGDQVLRCFTDTIKENIRENDIIGRYGGEEFILILQSRNCDEAKYALGRIRKKLGAQPLIHDEHVTFSCGHMFLDKYNCDMPIDDMVRAIDAKMYEAKALGKDRIV
jgi:diguanylate cyclase